MTDHHFEPLTREEAASLVVWLEAATGYSASVSISTVTAGRIATTLREHAGLQPKRRVTVVSEEEKRAAVRDKGGAEPWGVTCHDD